MAVSTITPTEFAAFRDELGPASGLQFYMYRQLECALGNKAHRMAAPYRPVGCVYKACHGCATGTVACTTRRSPCPGAAFWVSRCIASSATSPSCTNRTLRSRRRGRRSTGRNASTGTYPPAPNHCAA
ncbi:hypothetical protein I6J71_08760 [Amycolatopsis sp. FDAARGOS 1241]|nr:hypothetical protein I6J71_08760 [Amycolatopsis sp. FDAARGOS 1241]